MTNEKDQIEKYFCKLCGFIASNQEELDMHYRLSHDPDPDFEYEFEIKLVDKKTYQKLLYKDYLRICKGGGCVIRPRIDSTTDKNRIKYLYKRYCLECELRKFLIKELKKNGKL